MSFLTSVPNLFPYSLSITEQKVGPRSHWKKGYNYEIKGKGEEGSIDCEGDSKRDDIE